VTTKRLWNCICFFTFTWRRQKCVTSSWTGHRKTAWKWEYKLNFRQNFVLSQNFLDGFLNGKMIEYIKNINAGKV